MTEAQLMAKYPAIDWCAPVKVTRLGETDSRLVCRLCMAMNGFAASDLPWWPNNPEDFAKHMAFTHDLVAIFK